MLIDRISFYTIFNNNYVVHFGGSITVKLKGTVVFSRVEDFFKEKTLEAVTTFFGLIQGII
jgi:hypothetical protein